MSRFTMSRFIRAMRFVGDLDDEFYDDELHRDVWNEASAVGFQLFVWVSLVAAAILPWVAGIAGSWTSVGVLLVFLSVATAVLGYTRARGLDMHTSQKLTRARIYGATGIYLLGAGSAAVTLLAEYGGGNTRSIAAGASIGVCAGLAAGIHGIVRKRRLEREDEARAEQEELLELEKEG
ncbi:hypothetical protein [Rhodococcoides yunnanense]|uniref:hypothetical protein n=1 Tax=Rhodococcoides yunnanense TaxID=278209 RepID=UPI000A8736FA|nr:hypothetical protein [Rhodococcus yunnanensis]